MYKWTVIGIFVLGSFAMIPFRSEYWPFSSYSMFSSSLHNTVLAGHRHISLVGIRDNTEPVIIDSQLVTGSFRPGMISLVINKILKADRAEPLQCIESTMHYWKTRYLELHESLPEQLRNFDKLALTETKDLGGVSILKEVQLHE